jgi:hypothetical protein
VLARREGPEFGLDLYDVEDIQSAGDDPVVLRDLLLGSLKFARKERACRTNLANSRLVGWSIMEIK